MRLVHRRIPLPLFALLLVVCALFSSSASAEAPAATSTERLGLDLLRALPPGNLVVSPDSVAAALAMAGTGARGRTLDQIAEVLHMGESPLTSLGTLQRRIAKDAPQVEIANGLFVQSGLPLKPEFAGGLSKSFGAAPESLDFAGDSQGAVDAINAWTSKHTQGVIPKLFSELSPETALVLANAVYLKAKWKREFEANDTRPGTFHRAAGPVRAEFMHQAGPVLYGSGRGYRAVELPYRRSHLSMLVVLPVGGGVEGLEKRLGGTGLGGVVKKLKTTTLELSLPRFHIDTEAELESTLKRLGMPDAFAGGADFSGITAAGHLNIGAVRHIADIEVDEKGTEAAAATGVVATFEGNFFSEKAFVANHPFLFFVRDDATGAVLFAGRLTDPATATTE